MVRLGGLRLMPRKPRGRDYGAAPAPPPKLTTKPCPRPTKARYRTKREGKQALARRQEVSGRDELHVYRCRCDWFHIGHKRAPVRDEPCRYCAGGECALHVDRTWAGLPLGERVDDRENETRLVRVLTGSRENQPRPNEGKTNA